MYERLCCNNNGQINAVFYSIISDRENGGFDKGEPGRGTREEGEEKGGERIGLHS